MKTENQGHLFFHWNSSKACENSRDVSERQILLKRHSTKNSNVSKRVAQKNLGYRLKDSQKPLGDNLSVSICFFSYIKSELNVFLVWRFYSSFYEWKGSSISHTLLIKVSGGWKHKGKNGFCNTHPCFCWQQFKKNLIINFFLHKTFMLEKADMPFKRPRRFPK